VNTATSIRSLERLVIEPIIRHQNTLTEAWASNFVMYVDSSSAAYRILPGGSVAELDHYPFLAFTDAELESVLHSLPIAVGEFCLADATHKVKAGQVNFYCGGSWARRVQIATRLTSLIRSSGHSRVVAMVPSAKETIDIAVCRKDRGARDWLKRLNLNPVTVAVIGDSLQEGAPDLDMLLTAPGSLGVQVGSQVPPSNVNHCRIEPATEAVNQVLREILSGIR